ncbi:MAG: hypothetical protein ACLGG4_04195 [Gammaproteobacteria bacterium]
MKWIAWSLLAANLLLGGYFASEILWPRRVPAENAALNVEQLFLRGPSMPESRPETPSAVARLAPSAVPPPAEAFCMEWRGLASDEFGRARAQLKTIAEARVMSFVEVPLSTRHWVIFPPLPSTQSAATKLAELTAAGVTDAFVVKDAPWLNAISLGLYANDEAARRRVREVEARGVLGTRVEVLPRQGTEFYFTIRSEDPDALKALGEIKQAYPNSQQSRVACP